MKSCKVVDCVNPAARPGDLCAEHLAPRLAVGTLEAMPVVLPDPCAHCGEIGCTDMHPEPGDDAAMTIGGVPVVVTDAVASVMMVMPMKPAEETAEEPPRFTVGQLVLVTLRWTEERGRGRPAKDLQQVRLGTVRYLEAVASALVVGVSVPGFDAVQAVPVEDVEDAGAGCG